MSPGRGGGLRVLPHRSLVVRLYLFTLALILALSVSFYLVTRYVRATRIRVGMQKRNRFILSQTLTLSDDPAKDDPALLTRQLEHVRDGADLSATLFHFDGSRVASAARPPFAPVPDTVREELLRSPGPVLVPGCSGDPCLAVAVGPHQPPTAYAVFQFLRPPAPPEPMYAWLVMTLGGAAVLSVLVARSLARPLSKLAAAAEALGAGDLSTRVNLKRRDEIGAVAFAFDEMADRVSALLRSQTELLANVSHELRTPLARIRVAVDLAQEGDAELARESLEDIVEDLMELERLVGDILTAARLDSATGRIHEGSVPPLRRTRVAASDLLEKAVSRFKTQHPSRRLEVQAVEPPAWLEADAALLRRAVDNLLDNARKYSDSDSLIALRAHTEAGTWVVEVQDRGIGIDANDLPKVFQPFFRTDRSRARSTGGVGLGLALARRIVEGHGGSLTLSSEVGQGTRAVIRVPVQSQVPEIKEPGNILT